MTAAAGRSCAGFARTGQSNIWRTNYRCARSHLLSLDQPGALGLVLVVSWAVGQMSRGSRQPRRKEGKKKDVQG